MKKIKTYITGLAAAIALSIGFSACQDDVDAPAPVIPEAGIEANMTILDLKKEFWSDEKNYADSIYDPSNADRRFIIKGRVISSDKEGNIFKSLIIADGTAALAFSIDSYNLYLNYRRGQEIVLDVTGMTIGKYAGLEQMGHKSWYANGKTWQVSFMPYETFETKAKLNGMPDIAKIDTLTINTFADIPNDVDGLQKYQSQLVRFRNVYFADGGQKNFSVYHTKVNEEQNRTLVDRNGSTLIVRTSGYATWCEKRLPAGVIDLVGIMSYYNDSWQILMIDYEGVMPAVEMPGDKDKPYDVPGAIQEITDGITVNGWVKGYIVGAVAPEVEEVSSNSDIEWSAPTVLASTLVVAPDPSCKEIAQCLVVQLPSGSKFQEVGNLRANPGNLGKQILVKGDFVRFMGTPGITGNNGKPDQFEIEGVTVDTGEVADGDGQENSPYNVSQVVGKGSSVNEPGQWVKGYIVGFIPTGGASTTLPYTVFGTDGAIASNIVLAPTPDCTDPSLCIPVQLVSGSAVRSAVNLMDHPGNLGKLLSIKGDLIKYCGAPGVKNPSDYKLEGGDTPDVPDTPVGNPEGEGTAESPFNSVKALEMTKALAADVTTDKEYYVKGVVSSIKEISTQFGNGTYSITSAGSNVAFDIFRSYYLNGEKFSSTDQLKVGDEVVVCGKFVNYKGNTPQMAQGGKIVSLNGQGGDTPTPPGGDATGAGTAESPYNVAKAMQVIDGLGADVESDEVYVAGVISAIKEVSTSFGNATYSITDEGGSTVLGVFRGYWLNGEKFTSENQIKVGGKVVVKGKLVNYKGNTPQLTTGNQIVSYDGESGGDNPGGDTPGGDNPGGDTPATPGDAINIDLTPFKSDQTASGGFVMNTSVTEDGYKFTVSKGSGATAPVYNEYNGAGTLRLYADNTFTIEGAAIAKIVFSINTATGSKRYTTFTPSTGSVGTQAAGDESITWTGDAGKITFTVGHDATLGSDGASKRGQVHINKIEIYPAK